MLKKAALSKYALAATIIIAVLVTWMVSDYVHKEPVVQEPMPQPVVVEPVKKETPLPVEVKPEVEEIVEVPTEAENLKITARTFNRYPDDIPTLDELEVIGFSHGLSGLILQGMSLKETHQDNKLVSQREARGMFQIRPKTAKFLGVENIYDNYESADAAARYLAHLHERLFNLPLSEHSDYTLQIVLAAYNAGPNRLRKVGKGYLPPNFRETREYVADIMGFYKGTKYYVRKGDTIAGIANQHDMHPEILMSVNGLRYIKLGEGRITTNLIAGKFINVGQSMYLVTRGDTLYSIARRMNTTVKHLRTVNDIPDPKKLEVGRLLVI